MAKHIKVDKVGVVPNVTYTLTPVVLVTMNLGDSVDRIVGYFKDENEAREFITFDRQVIIDEWEG